MTIGGDEPAGVLEYWSTGLTAEQLWDDFFLHNHS